MFTATWQEENMFLAKEKKAPHAGGWVQKTVPCQQFAL
jgi:hypothetical protein